MPDPFDFASDPRPIGVFDSGVGGLTVLKALMERLPGQRFVYLGDTARVPYGTKSAETVKTYSLALAKILLAEDVKMIVIACNTASAHATQAVAAMAGAIPVIGMIEPATDAALRSGIDNILVMATQSTIQNGCYETALSSARDGMIVRGVSAQVLVSLAEEGWHQGPVADAAVSQYLSQFFDGPVDARPKAIILACTHFPLLKNSIAALAGQDVVMIETGVAAADQIVRDHGPFPGKPVAEVRFLVTDSVERFRPTVKRFLAFDDAALKIEQINI